MIDSQRKLLQPSKYSISTILKEPTDMFQIPLQFLAAEYEIQWKSVEQGRPIFEQATSFFTNTPRLDAKFLLGGGHNFEFSNNASTLYDFRVQFIDSLVVYAPFKVLEYSLIAADKGQRYYTCV